MLIGEESSGNLSLSRGDIGGNDRIWAYNWDGNEDRVGVAYSVDTWQHFAWVHGSGNLTLYKDGASAGSVASGNTAGLSGRVKLGQHYLDASAVYLNGRVAEAAAWNVELTADELAALGKGVSPQSIRPASLTAYWPLVGQRNPEISLRAGFELTRGNSPQAAEHCRIIYPTVGVRSGRTTPGPISGTSDLVFGVGSTTLAGVGTLAGVASLTVGASSTLLGAGALAGASPLVFTGSTGATIVSANGSAAVIFAAEAQLLGLGALAGSAAITVTGSASLSGGVQPPGGRFSAFRAYCPGFARAKI